MISESDPAIQKITELKEAESILDVTKHLVRKADQVVIEARHRHERVHRMADDTRLEIMRATTDLTHALENLAQLRQKIVDLERRIAELKEAGHE